MINKIFELISKIKDVKKQKLIILKSEEKIIIQFYFLYKMYRYISLWKFRNAVLNNQIENITDIITSIDDVIYKIISKNG